MLLPLHSLLVPCVEYQTDFSFVVVTTRPDLGFSLSFSSFGSLSQNLLHPFPYASGLIPVWVCLIGIVGRGGCVHGTYGIGRYVFIVYRLDPLLVMP